MCGIAGAIGVPNAAYRCQLMLLALNHRGQTGAGIAARDATGAIKLHRGQGLVERVFDGYDVRANLQGDAAVAQNRYPTAGSANDPRATQPIRKDTQHGEIVVVHNGNLTNSRRLRADFELHGATFDSSADTELFPMLYGASRAAKEETRLVSAFRKAEGAFSVLGLTANSFFAARDHEGMRPLVMGRHPSGGLVFASETRAFDILALDGEITDIRDVPPGKLLMANGALTTCQFAKAGSGRRCSFEDVYFSMVDSVVEGETVSRKRRRLGVQLAKRIRSRGIEVDVVIGVPNSAIDIAQACAEYLGVPYGNGLIRNGYVHRTFINPNEEERALAVIAKLNVDRSVVEGKRVLVVDDSIVRGTTSRIIIDFLRRRGATEVHVGVGSPAVLNPCYWGIDTPHRTKLISAQYPAGELHRFLGANSITFLEVSDLLEALNDPLGERTCWSCFDPFRRRPIAHHILDLDGYDLPAAA